MAGSHMSTQCRHLLPVGPPLRTVLVRVVSLNKVVTSLVAVRNQALFWAVAVLVKAEGSEGIRLYLQRGPFRPLLPLSHHPTHQAKQGLVHREAWGTAQEEGQKNGLRIIPPKATNSTSRTLVRSRHENPSCLVRSEV